MRHQTWALQRPALVPGWASGGGRAVLGQATAFRPGRPDQAEYLEIQSASNQALVLKAFLRDSQLVVLDFWTNIDLDRFRCS
jgi:hypothetical protein